MADQTPSPGCTASAAALALSQALSADQKKDAEIARLKAFRDNVAASLCVESEHGPVDDDAIVEAKLDAQGQEKP